MSVVVGDSLATGDALTDIDAALSGNGPRDPDPAADLLAEADAAGGILGVDGVGDAAGSDQEVSAGDLDKAKRRATVLYKLKKNRKRKSIGQEDATLQLRVEATAAMKKMSNSLDSLVQLFAERNGRQRSSVAPAGADNVEVDNSEY
jgi:hypothetical protein